MSYLTEYEEIDGGYVAFGGNPNGGKIIRKGEFDGKANEGFFVGYSLNSKAFKDDEFKPSSDDGKKVDEDPSKGNECYDQEKEINSTNNVNNVSSTVNAAGINRVNAIGELPFDPDMPALEDVGTFDFSNEDEDDNAVADMNNLDTTIQIKEEVYVCQPPGFEDPDFLDRVYKVEIALYELHQAPRAWYETLLTYLLDNGFQKGEIGKTLFIKRHKGDILLVQVYMDDIIFGSIRKELCNAFKRLMHEKFQMSSMGELIFFLGLQVKQKNDDIFISQDKYVAEILKKFGFTEVKNASTPMETQKTLLKDEDMCACARYQVNPKVSHLYAVKKNFRYLKGQLKLGLWYPKDSPFDLVAYTDSDYARARLDRKSTTGVLLVILNNVELELLVILNTARKPKRKVTQVPQLSGPTKSVTDEAVYKELDDSLVRFATTASSLEAEQVNGNIDKAQSKETPNESSSQRTDSSGGPRVLELEKTKTSQGNKIASLKRKVKKLEKRNKSRTHKLKRLYKVGLTARVESSDNEKSLGEVASKQGKRINDIDADEDITLMNVQANVKMFDADKDLGGKEVFVEQEVVVDKEKINEVTLAQALAELKTLKPKGVVIQEPSKSPTTTTTVPKQKSQDKGKRIMVKEPMKHKRKDQIRLDEEATLKLQAEIETWDDVQAKINADYQLAERLQAEEQQELTDEKKATLFMQFLEKRRKFFATKRAKEKRNKPPTQAQKGKIIAFERVNTSEPISLKLVQGKEKRAEEELIQKRANKKKVDDDKETTKLKELMEIIPDKKEVAIDAISLAVKSLGIVDWKTNTEIGASASMSATSAFGPSATGASASKASASRASVSEERVGALNMDVLLCF
nr:hypothetical protein [Tanacetum cinerariifolium]